MTPKYSAVLFDWDGCLAKTVDVWIEGFEKTFAAFGLQPERRLIARHFGNWDTAVRLGVPAEENARFSEMLIQSVGDGPGEADLYPGAIELLQALRSGGVAVAMVTSAQLSHIERATQHHGIADLFDAIVTVEDVVNHKPHAEPIEVALRRLGSPKSDAVMIGDSTNDLGAAVNAGVDSILVFHPEHDVLYDREFLQTFNPTYVCESFTAVRDVLLPDD